MIIFLLDAAPLGGGIGIFVGIAFFLVLAAAAFIAFKMLKKTVKMAFRMAIVAIILAVAIVGSISFWWLSSSRPASPAPKSTKTK